MRLPLGTTAPRVDRKADANLLESFYTRTSSKKELVHFVDSLYTGAVGLRS